MLSKYKYTIIISVFLLLAVTISSSSGLFKNINNNIYDYYLELNQTRQKNSRLVLVKIDDKTIKELDGWPIKRTAYVQLLEIIFKNKAQAAGFFLEFSSQVDKKNDELFLKALQRYPTIVLTPFTFNTKKPDTTYWQKLTHSTILSHDVLISDEDEVVRNFIPVLNNVPSFAFALLNTYNNKQFSFKEISNTVYIKQKPFTQANSTLIPVHFKTSQFNFPSYSLVDVLNHKVNGNVFNNKIVLIGLTKERSTAFYKTPFSKNNSISNKIAPIYIQAQIIDAFLNYSLISKLDPVYIFIFLVVYIPIIVKIIKELNIPRQVSIIMAISVLELLLTYAAFKLFHFWISPLYMLVSNLYMLIIITIVSQLKVSRFLDSYLEELEAKTDQQTSSASELSVDSKLHTLKEITSLIEKDRDIFDTVLSSVRSLIVLFNKEGEVIYSNTKSSALSIEALITRIDFKTALNALKTDQKYSCYFKHNNKEFEFILNKAREDLFTGVFNDITEIAQINETKNTIVRMLSHELKTPLTSIMLSCDCLFALNTNEKLENYINRIIGQTDFIREIISDFLELNKIEIAEFELHKTPLNIQDLFDSLTEHFADICESKTIKLNLNYKNLPAPVINADKKYLTIAFKNLIDNALKYSPENTEINIQFGIVESNLQVLFIDQGYGMEQDCIEKLFKKFYRIKNDKTEHIQGTGLGLSFVKKIIELHNGTINVASQPGLGTTFTVSLPANSFL